MTLTYLAGPILGTSDVQASDWRAVARAALGGRVLDPMTRDYRGREAGNSAAIVSGDLADIDRCDSVLAFCWTPSYGTAMEIFYAFHAGKRVVVVVPAGPVSPWLVAHSSVVTRSLQEGLDVVLREPLRS